jgi:hypothetical protein
MVLRTVLFPVIRNFAKDRDRKRTYLNARFIEGRVMAAPTPCVAKPDEPDVHIVTPLPIQNYTLSTWVKSLQEHPEICKKYGVGIAPKPTSDAQETPDTEDIDMEDVEMQPEDLEEPVPTTMEEMKATGQDADTQIAKIIENEVRQNTAPVSSH